MRNRANLKFSVILVFLLCEIHFTASPQNLKPPPTAPGEFELQTAREYEKSGRWKDAEQMYLQAGRAGNTAAKQEALAGIGRVREKQRFSEAVETFDRWIGYVARVVGLFVLGWIVWRLATISRGIRIAAFSSSDENIGKRLSFWICFVRDQLISAEPRLDISPALMEIPYVLLPGLEDEIPDPAKDVEIGGTRLPLGDLLNLLRRPRVKVLGSWVVGTSSGRIYAEVRRRNWFSYNSASEFTHSVPSATGDPQDQALELFAYDVFIRALTAYEPE